MRKIMNFWRSKMLNQVSPTTCERPILNSNRFMLAKVYTVLQCSITELYFLIIPRLFANRISDPIQKYPVFLFEMYTKL